MVSTSSNRKLYDDFEEIESGKLSSLHTSILGAFRREYPELCITVALASNVNLVQFAAFGNAVAELDTISESVQRMRFFYRGNDRRGIPDQLAESRSFAKYQYQWGTEYFIVYTIQVGYYMFQYILKEPSNGETTLSQPSATDALIDAVGKWQKPDEYVIFSHHLTPFSWGLRVLGHVSAASDLRKSYATYSSRRYAVTLTLKL